MPSHQNPVRRRRPCGYLRPLQNDYLSRRMDVWFACHLGKGLSWDVFYDQDFMNLLVR